MRIQSPFRVAPTTLACTRATDVAEWPSSDGRPVVSLSADAQKTRVSESPGRGERSARPALAAQPKGSVSAGRSTGAGSFEADAGRPASPKPARSMAGDAPGSDDRKRVRIASEQFRTPQHPPPAEAVRRPATTDAAPTSSRHHDVTQRGNPPSAATPSRVAVVDSSRASSRPRSATADAVTHFAKVSAPTGAQNAASSGGKARTAASQTINGAVSQVGEAAAARSVHTATRAAQPPSMAKLEKGSAASPAPMSSDLRALPEVKAAATTPPSRKGGVSAAHGRPTDSATAAAVGSAICAAQSVLQIPTERAEAEAGVECCFLIQTRDARGNPVRAGPRPFVLQLFGRFRIGAFGLSRFNLQCHPHLHQDSSTSAPRLGLSEFVCT